MRFFHRFTMSDVEPLPVGKFEATIVKIRNWSVPTGIDPTCSIRLIGSDTFIDLDVFDLIELNRVWFGYCPLTVTPGEVEDIWDIDLKVPHYIPTDIVPAGYDNVLEILNTNQYNYEWDQGNWTQLSGSVDFYLTPNDHCIQKYILRIMRHDLSGQGQLPLQLPYANAVRINFLPADEDDTYMVTRDAAVIVSAETPFEYGIQLCMQENRIINSVLDPITLTDTRFTSFKSKEEIISGNTYVKVNHAADVVSHLWVMYVDNLFI